MHFISTIFEDKSVLNSSSLETKITVWVIKKKMPLKKSTTPKLFKRGTFSKNKYKTEEKKKKVLLLFISYTTEKQNRVIYHFSNS